MPSERVDVIKEFNTCRFIGELQKFSYQMALGVSIRKFEGEWALRIYFLKFKFWLNFKRRPA